MVVRVGMEAETTTSAAIRAANGKKMNKKEREGRGVISKKNPPSFFASLALPPTKVLLPATAAFPAAGRTHSSPPLHSLFLNTMAYVCITLALSLSLFLSSTPRGTWVCPPNLTYFVL